MKSIKRVLALGLVTIMSMGSFIGCSKAENDKKIGIVLSTLNNPFFVSMKNGAEKEAEKLGYELIVLDSQDDPVKERSNVEDLIQLGVVALLINPTDSDAVIKAVEIANESNVPVITLDRQSNGGEVTSHIASDNIKGGAMAAEFALEELGSTENFNVVEIQGIPGGGPAALGGTRQWTLPRRSWPRCVRRSSPAGRSWRRRSWSGPSTPSPTGSRPGPCWPPSFWTRGPTPCSTNPPIIWTAPAGIWCPAISGDWTGAFCWCPTTGPFWTAAWTTSWP